MNSLQSQYKSLLTSCARCLLLRRNIMVYESSRKAEYEHKVSKITLRLAFTYYGMYTPSFSALIFKL